MRLHPDFNDARIFKHQRRSLFSGRGDVLRRLIKLVGTCTSVVSTEIKMPRNYGKYFDHFMYLTTSC